MKYTEKQIKEVGKQVLISLGRFSSEYKIEKVVLKTHEEVFRGPLKGKSINIWTVVIYVENIFGETTDFLTINDETGEPIDLQTKHWALEIEKNNGEYQFKDS